MKGIIKIISCSVILFICSINKCKSQFNQPPYNPKVGVLAGVQISNIVTSAGMSLTPLSSYHFGALVEIPLFDYYSLAPQVIYSLQGFKQLANGQPNAVDTTTEIAFLNFPVEFKFYVYKGLAIEPTVYIGFIVNTQKTFLDLNHDPMPENKTIISSDYIGNGTIKKFDYGLGLGLSYNFKFGLICKLKYYFGGQNLLPDKEGLPAGKTEMVQFSIGYLFKNKK